MGLRCFCPELLGSAISDSNSMCRNQRRKGSETAHMTTTAPIYCRYCHHAAFADYATLAQHVAAERKGHRGGKKWAARYLTRVNFLNQKRDLKPRTPLTEQEKENRVSTFVELSGQNEIVTTLCSHCKSRTRQSLPIEYTRSNTAWRNKQGILVVSCPTCQK